MTLLVDLITAEWREHQWLADLAHSTTGMTPEDVRTFWDSNQDALPHLFCAAQDLILGQPSSAVG